MYSSTKEAQEDHIKNYKSDGIAKGKGGRYSSDYLRVKWVNDEIGENSTVLDVGCNGGTIAVQLMQKGCYVKGIDIVQELVEKAIKRGVFAEQGTAEDLSRFNDNEFDNVICCEVLEHLYDPLPAIKEAHRVLKHGGKYIITVPHPNGLMGGEKLGDYHHQNFTVELLDTLLHQDFKRGNVMFVEIPYVKEYCIAHGIDENKPQWLGFVCIK